MTWFGRRRRNATTPAEEVADPALAAALRGMRLAKQGPQPTGEGPQMTPAAVSAMARWFREGYRAGQHTAVWQRRAELGYGVPFDGVSQEDQFWFNAAPALAALHSGMRDHPMTAMCCGVAEDSVDRANPEQMAAVEEFNQLYHG